MYSVVDSPPLDEQYRDFKDDAFCNNLLKFNNRWPSIEYRKQFEFALTSLLYFDLPTGWLLLLYLFIYLFILIIYFILLSSTFRRCCRRLLDKIPKYDH